MVFVPQFSYQTSGIRWVRYVTHSITPLSIKCFYKAYSAPTQMHSCYLMH